MAFAAGFMLVIPRWRDEPKRSELKRYLESLGFELYETGKPNFIVFYVEAPDVKALEEKIKTAERHEGIAKAYIAYGFMADDETRWMINEMLARGELELDKSMIDYLKTILARLEAAQQRQQGASGSS